MEIGFLFGAGISKPAGFPLAFEITQQILTGKDVYRHTDERYYINPRIMESYLDFIPRVTGFVKLIYNEINNFYNGYRDKILNYEDIFYICKELCDNEKGEIENIAIESFKKKITPAIKPYLKKFRDENRELRLMDLFDESCNYIKDSVCEMLSIDEWEFEYLNFLGESFEDQDISKINIFTLNHDTLLENYFKVFGINYIDGFDKPINNVKYWNPVLFKKENEKVINLFKIHGSINWYRLPTGSGDWYGDRYGIMLKSVNYGFTDPGGNKHHAFDCRPLFLVGSFNKISEYTNNLFIDVFIKFYQKLNKIDNLIISGYSFNDKGVNTRIANWVYQNKNKRIIVIDPNIDKVEEYARGAISGKWNSWIRDGVVKIIRDSQTDKTLPIEEITWELIKENLNFGNDHSQGN